MVNESRGLSVQALEENERLFDPSRMKQWASS